jgi:hypothetical protein
VQYVKLPASPPRRPLFPPDRSLARLTGKWANVPNPPYKPKLLPREYVSV